MDLLRVVACANAPHALPKHHTEPYPAHSLSRTPALSASCLGCLCVFPKCDSATCLGSLWYPLQCPYELEPCDLWYHVGLHQATVQIAVNLLRPLGMKPDEGHGIVRLVEREAAQIKRKLADPIARTQQRLLAH